MIARDSQIIALTPTADHTDLEGYVVKNSSGSAALVSGATDTPLGVILSGATTSGKDSVALAGFHGTVKVKLTSSPGTVNAFTLLQIHTDGCFKADAGSGARVLTAVALESGSANELIEARLIARPVHITAQTQTSLTDSSGGTPGATLAAITQAANAGSADVGPVKNAIASIAAQLELIKADVAVALARQ